MERLEHYKMVFVAVGIISIVLFAMPSVSLILPSPVVERFSELWLLGSNHMADDYPFNIKADESYLIHLGVANHLGSSAYYTVKVKVRNQTEPSPEGNSGVPSSLQPLFEYHVFLSDSRTWEREVSFSFDWVSPSNNTKDLTRLTINGSNVDINKTAAWDQGNNGFYYQLFFELWKCNIVGSGLQYDNRFVGIWLNVTNKA
jgi:hypothetical protein